MRSFSLAIALLSLAICCTAAAEDISPEYYVRIAIPAGKDLGKSVQELSDLGVSLERVKKTQDFVEGYVIEDLVDELHKSGYKFERLVHPSEQRLVSANGKRSSVDSMGGYTHYENLTNYLIAMEQRNPGIAKRFVIGTSSGGRAIQGIRITKNPDQRENEPEVKYLANIHGDEAVGREISIYFIDMLLQQYNAVPSTPLSERITQLIDSTDIYIIPSINPDGFELGRRANTRGRDLNRNFPDLRFPGRETGAAELETTAIMSFCKAHHFVLSASFHGGSVVANYPYDGNYGYRSGVNEPSADDDVFRHISLVYSNAHTTMHSSTEFHNGITNGAEWYVLYGGMQDWNYEGLGTFEVTLEVSDDKYPAASRLPGFWDQNKEAMLQYLEQVHTGLRGVVTDATTGTGLEATITVEGRKPAKADPAFGNYYRLLRPGTYTVTASMPGYESQTSTIVIPAGQQVYSTVSLNFSLARQ